MQPKFKRILYGGDYNPNQWPEIWKEDMRIFKDARINSATINVFSWAKIQPSENEYNFSELDKVVEMLSEENYDIVFATSTAALPGWMVKKYPKTTPFWTAPQCLPEFSGLPEICKSTGRQTGRTLCVESACHLLACEQRVWDHLFLR